ncbi:hypothetical protein FE257_010432 [Aspergillus nanangensis]|uniref:Calcineurin-like phosphoesterase domain-containing protein n=1 Tax=Aspergillus nanangensis TaxID=2582783 RepID=A0AAD4CK02_ASPNN|nr:hypothetical protein FE257_010432 [Aspergillus nanangensis]
MRDKADRLNVDLLVVDTGDLVNGNGLSDTTDVPGRVSGGLFQNLEFDLLTLGNNDLYSAVGTRDIHSNFSRIYGDRFITSNVYIEIEGKNVTVGQPYRHFTTKHGLRIMAFGFTLLDFKLNMKKSGTYVRGYAEVIKEQWFQDAMKVEDVDLYVLLGHAELREGCVMDGRYAKENPMLCMEAHLRNHGQNIPIQVFGGHTHERDFKCFDERSSGLQSGRYSDTVGWLALRGVAPSDTWNGNKALTGVQVPTRRCPPASSKSAMPVLETTTGHYIDRRYLDFNRRTFVYHAVGTTEPDVPDGFDTPLGRKVSDDIWKTRRDMNLTTVLGCAPRSSYLWVCPEGSAGNIFTLAKEALGETVRRGNSPNPRVIIMNGGSFRYDLYKGPFTVGNALAISPYKNTFSYIPDVPGNIALSVLDCLLEPTKNIVTTKHTEDIEPLPIADIQQNSRQQVLHARHMSIPQDHREPNPGHVTIDDFGNCTASPDSDDCGDDTKHEEVKELYPNAPYFQYQDSDITEQTEKVDLVFMGRMQDLVLQCDAISKRYSAKDVIDYMGKGFTTRDVLQEFATRKWAAALADQCPIGR